MNRIPTIILLLLLLGGSSYAQHRCATTILQSRLNRSFPEKFDEHKFENWISEKRAERKFGVDTENEVYRIPVVVHVIHNGEEVGTGVNLPNEKIIEQIELLNKDFRRTNDDAINTPSEYSSVTADVEIEFVLAVRDPEGLPTTGITRTRGTMERFKFSEDAILKSHIYWPAEDYMNIYIADLQSFLGWAQFPVMNLDGLDGEFDTERLTDGVALDYKYVGINDDTNSFDSFGRTATHEIGHYLGLRHIWGDGGCSVDDYCEDTPFSNDDTDGCPSEKTTCGTRDMIENFMDYTNDECMNLFTVCQKERMRIVMENSPRRRSLLNSPALIAPQIFSFDLGIKEIDVDADLSICNSSITPQVQIRNHGAVEIDSFKIEMTLNGSLVSEELFFQHLETGDLVTVSFPQITTSLNTNNTLSFEIKEVNGQGDPNGSNNSLTKNFFTSNKMDLPLSEDFENSLTSWNQTNFPIENPYWQQSLAPQTTVSNQAYKVPYYSTSNNVYGNFDYLITPVLDLSSFSNTSLEFDYAYAPRPGFFTDGLIVAVSTDCGETFLRDDYLFEKYGNQLASSSSLNQEFIPISENDWRTELIDLSDYSDEENVRIAFIGVNGGGNNLFLDNIQIQPSNQLQLDVGIGEVSNISILSCIGEFTPLVEVKNFGSETITNLDINYRSRPNGSYSTASFNNININPGKSGKLSLPDNVIDNSSTVLDLEIVSINGLNDEDESNNSFSTNITINTAEEFIPARERFESTIEWSLLNNEGASNWEVYDDSFNKSLLMPGFILEELGVENWLVSPVLLSEGVTEASMTFKVSYAQRLERVDGLKVLLSNNCGQSWDNVLYNKQGSILAIENSNTEWVPIEEDDWRTEFIDLSEYLPENSLETMRIAFVATNGNGNNIYLDDIEIYNTSTPNLNSFEEEVLVYPNPTSGSFNVSLNLDKKEDVRIVLTDIMGKVVFESLERNVLNQNFIMETEGLGGIYFLYLVGDNIEISRRVLINR